MIGRIKNGTNRNLLPVKSRYAPRPARTGSEKNSGVKPIGKYRVALKQTPSIQSAQNQSTAASAVECQGRGGLETMASNGEVEGPDDHAGEATRAHNLFPRLRRPG